MPAIDEVRSDICRLRHPTTVRKVVDLSYEEAQAHEPARTVRVPRMTIATRLSILVGVLTLLSGASLLERIAAGTAIATWWSLVVGVGTLVVGGRHVLIAVRSITSGDEDAGLAQSVISACVADPRDAESAAWLRLIVVGCALTVAGVLVTSFSARVPWQTLVLVATYAWSPIVALRLSRIIERERAAAEHERQNALCRSTLRRMSQG